jgi:hypothetical protein
MRQGNVGVRARNIAIVAGALVLIGFIIWLDVSTAVWSEVVILSGIAAGLVTFILTVMVLDKILARSTARRWAPVTRLALSEFLHAIADNEHSEITRGHIVSRSLPEVACEEVGGSAAHNLRVQVVAERELLTDILSRWAGFLAASSNSETVLLHVADIAIQLDAVRDAALDYEHMQTNEKLDQLNASVRACNASFVALEHELNTQLEEEARLRTQ